MTREREQYGTKVLYESTSAMRVYKGPVAYGSVRVAVRFCVGKVCVRPGIEINVRLGEFML